MAAAESAPGTVAILTGFAMDPIDLFDLLLISCRPPCLIPAADGLIVVVEIFLRDSQGLGRFTKIGRLGTVAVGWIRILQRISPTALPTDPRRAILVPNTFHQIAVNKADVPV